MSLFNFNFLIYFSFQIGDILEFPIELNMKPYYVAATDQSISAEKKNENFSPKIQLRSDYELSSIIVHEGSADFGHYICYARPDPKKMPDLWLKLNDQSVSKINFKDVCDVSYGSKHTNKFSKNAYLLFYTRKS